MSPDVLIRTARSEAGLTQSQLAAHLGISQSAIAELERKGSNPTVGTLDRVLRATGQRLQLIAPARGTATGVPGPSIDVGLVTRHLGLTPEQRIAGLEQMYAESRTIGSTVAEASAFALTKLLRRLVDGGVDFVVVGGVAVVAHAMPRFTNDLDICYARSADNLDALGRVLVAICATLPGADAGLPFVPHGRTLRETEILTLSPEGDIDLLVERAGCPPYPELRANADRIQLAGAEVLIASVDDLIAMRRAAGRPQDLIDLEALEIARARRS